MAHLTFSEYTDDGSTAVQTLPELEPEGVILFYFLLLLLLFFTFLSGLVCPAAPDARDTHHLVPTRMNIPRQI